MVIHGMLQSNQFPIYKALVHQHHEYWLQVGSCDSYHKSFSKAPRTTHGFKIVCTVLYELHKLTIHCRLAWNAALLCDVPLRYHLLSILVLQKDIVNWHLHDSQTEAQPWNPFERETSSLCDDQNSNSCFKPGISSCLGWTRIFSVPLLSSKHIDLFSFFLSITFSSGLSVHLLISSVAQIIVGCRLFEMQAVRMKMLQCPMESKAAAGAQPNY